MKKSLPQYLYSRLWQLFHKLKDRLNNHFKSGRFHGFSKTQQLRLLKRLEKIYKKLTFLEQKAKFAGLALVSTAALYSTEAEAQIGLLGSEFKVNSYTTSSQNNPVISIDDNGNFVIAWHSEAQDGSAVGVFAQRFDNTGVAQGGEFKVNTFTNDSQEFPSVAMDADGDFVVTWHSYSQDTPFSFGVYAQRYNASGVAQGGEFKVNTYTAGIQSYPAVAIDDDGDFVIAWNSKNQDGNGYGIYAQRYNALGSAQGGEFLVNTYTTNDQRDPSIAMDADGDFIVTWTSNNQEGSGYGIYGQRYNASGVAQGGEFHINTTTTSSQSMSSVAMAALGDFVVTWQSSFNSQDLSWGINAQRYDASGVAQGTEFSVNSYTTGEQSFPAISMNNDGDFLITWRSLNQDGSNDGVYAQLFDDLGSTVDSEFLVNTYTTSFQYYSTAALQNSGDFVLTWQSYAQDGDNFGIYAQRYDASSSTTNTAPSIATQTFSIAENSTVSSSVGTVIASESDAGQSLTYAITNGNSEGKFAINTTTGEITTTGSLDFETTSSYSLTIEVADNGTPVEKASATITINITDVSNENAPSISPQTFATPETSYNGSSVGTVVAMDTDAGQTISFAITNGNSAGKFAIDQNTGEITVAGTLDFETTPSYGLTIEVSDNGTPVKKASALITINITDIVETGIRSSAINSGITLFPNPAKGEVMIELEGRVGIKIINLSGQVVKELQTVTSSFNIQGINPGVYTVELSQEDTKVYKKLVIE